MRWESLFADLEAQLDAADSAELAAEVQERIRHEMGSRTLLERLRTGRGRELRVALADGALIVGLVQDIGPDWLLIADGVSPATEVLIPLAALDWVQGLGRDAELGDPGRVWRRVDLRTVLRALVRSRAGVRLVVRTGTSHDGTLDRVGADHVDLAVHYLDEPRRADAIRAVRSVPLAAIVMIRRVS